MSRNGLQSILLFWRDVSIESVWGALDLREWSERQCGGNTAGAVAESREDQMNPFDKPPLPCPACHTLDGQSIAREVPGLDIAIAHYRCNACGLEGPQVTIPADDMHSLRMFDLASAAWNCRAMERARPARRQAPVHG